MGFNSGFKGLILRYPVVCDVLLSGVEFAAKRAFLLTALRVRNYLGVHNLKLLQPMDYYIYTHALPTL